MRIIPATNSVPKKTQAKVVIAMTLIPILILLEKVIAIVIITKILLLLLVFI